MVEKVPGTDEGSPSCIRGRDCRIANSKLRNVKYTTRVEIAMMWEKLGGKPLQCSPHVRMML